MSTVLMRAVNKSPRTPLAQGNEALRNGDFASAVVNYAQAIVQTPELAKMISANVSMARKKYRANRQSIEKKSVAVCGWELAHSSAGRAYTLATLYETFAHVEIIGSLFSSFGREIWEPIRDTPITKHTFVVDDESKFLEQAIQLVAAHPYDIVHLSKPRAPNIFFGILYKLIWDAKVLMDIDDEELAFVREETPISIDEYINQNDKLPKLKNLTGVDWTRLAVGLAKEFDGVTVSNAALQKRYGGEIIRHARNENIYNPSSEFSKLNREKFGIPLDKKVILFLGTPREHKGLLEIANAIEVLGRKDFIFLVAGSFVSQNLKKRLLEINISYIFLENKSVDNVPEIISLADCYVLFNDIDNGISKYQVPAKLSDSLAMGVPVVICNSSLQNNLDLPNGIMQSSIQELPDTLLQVAFNKNVRSELKINAFNIFINEFSFSANVPKLKDVSEKSNKKKAWSMRFLDYIESLSLKYPTNWAEVLGSLSVNYSKQLYASRNYINKLKHSRLVIYTAIAGAYDVLQDPLHVIPGCEYVAFSDRPINSSIWKVIPFNYYEDDPARAARFVKLHPHIYFQNHEISIWLDANISLLDEPIHFIDKISSDIIGMFPHPHRQCVYVEANECIKRKKDNEEILTSQAVRYRKDGFPENFGLWETGVIIRRHNDHRCINLMNFWWKELFVSSRRDQISLPVALHTTKVTICDLAPKGTDLRTHPLISYVKHPTSEKSEPCSIFREKTKTHLDCESIPIDVGICVYNAHDESRACIESVINNRGAADRIILIDDCSAEETMRMLVDFANNHPRILLIRHNENQGYTRSANDVLRNSVSPYVVLLNSDTILSRGSLRRLVAWGEKYPYLGIIGPLSNAAGWQTVPVLHDPNGGFKVNPLPQGFSIDDMARLCADLSLGTIPFLPLVNGFCFAIKRAVIEAIGYFDEDEFPIGYGEEDDFCLRAGYAGFQCGVATDAYVFHAKSISFTSEKRKILAKKGGIALRNKHTKYFVDKAASIAENNPLLNSMRRDILEIIKQNVSISQNVKLF